MRKTEWYERGFRGPLNAGRRGKKQASTALKHHMTASDHWRAKVIIFEFHQEVYLAYRPSLKSRSFRSSKSTEERNFYGINSGVFAVSVDERWRG
jgi:hypothetical protein